MIRDPLAARFSRRAFVTGASAALVPWLAGSPRLAARAAGAPRVAIVGAGIAGLTAALALHERGVAFTLFEAQLRVGGRMRSETAFWGNGQTSEYCGELLDSSHTAMRALAKRFGLALTDVLAAEPEDSEQTIFERGAYYRERDLWRDFRPVYRTLAQQVRDAGPVTTYARSTAAGRALDALSLRAWIERFVPGGVRSNVGAYILLQYVAEYGIEADKQSSLNMVYWLGRQPQYNEATGEFTALGPSDERFHIRGGNEQLPRAMAATLPNDALRLGHRLEAIARRSDGRVRLDFDTADGPHSVTVDQAIVTLPFSVLRDVDTSRAGFDARKRIAIAQLGYGEHSKLVVQFDERFWNGRGAWPGRGSGDVTYDGAFSQTWETSRGQHGAAGMLADYAAAGESAAMHPPAAHTTSATAATARYAAAFVSELERVLPGARAHFTGKATLSHPTMDPFARGSYAGWLVGQYTRFAGYERVRQGNVHFAGEHCSVELQGFMEGAAREGARAAHEVLRDAGLRASA
jgi:monoamine oxidase